MAMTARTHATEPLRRLARLYGIQTDYYDVTGERHPTPADTLSRLVRALGGHLPAIDGAAEAARIRRRELAARPLPPVAVVWDGASTLLPLTRPRHLADAPFLVRVHLEDGGVREKTIRPADLRRLRVRDVDGVPMVTHALPVPAGLPPGYHRMVLELGGEPITCRIISAPRLAHVPAEPTRERTWGVFAPVYALHSERSLGIGDFSDLRSLMDWVGDQGGTTVATLPLLASFLDEPCHPSPYTPVSRQFWNEIFLDLARIPELARCTEAQRELGDRTFRAEIEALRAAPEVDYAGVMAAKRRVLSTLAEWMFTRSSRRRTALERFAADHPQLEDYAAFRAVGERQRAPWQSWPERLRNGRLVEGDYDEAAFRYHSYVQWLAAEQLAEIAGGEDSGGTGLYLDLPVGVHPDGFDVWRERHLYTEGISVGAPPDPLAPEGQDWGFPALIPDANRIDGYRHFAAIIEHHMRHADVLRIDHIMGLHRLFWIPAGATAREGAYVRYPHQELYAVLCLESRRNRCLVVGEDLGTVPAPVRPAMAEHNVHRMFVMQSGLEANVEDAFEGIPDRSVASLNTHDMPPFAAFWQGGDIDRWERLGFLSESEAESARHRRDTLRHDVSWRLAQNDRADTLDPTTVLRGCLDAMAAGPAEIEIVNLEDTWLETRPQNVPGTTDQHPNWQGRMRYGLEAIRDRDDVHGTLDEVDRIRRGEEKAKEMTTAATDDDSGNGAADPTDPNAPDSQVEWVVDPAAGWRPWADVHLTDHDLYLFNEGSFFRIYEKFGAHPTIKDDVEGVVFTVWAPNAERVSVMGSFNDWSTDRHPMHGMGDSGVWTVFVAGAGPGDSYKYRIRSRTGDDGDKADPVAFRGEMPPETGSVVASLAYEWNDDEWMSRRPAQKPWEQPISIYELHLGSWMRSSGSGGEYLSYRELAPRLVAYLRRLGFTHVELLPVMEHPYYASWGYQTTGYFAPSTRYGSPQDFMYLVDQLHQAGIGVILDWVPSHFPTDAHGLGFFDGTHLYEHADPQKGFHPDWKSLIFNYGRHEVRSFLISNVFYWLDRYHADGIRVDAVASMLYLDYSREEDDWIPNEYGGKENLEAIAFLRRLNEEIGAHYPGVLRIAEESTAWPMVSRPTYVGGLGFDFKWDMGWMHDTLRYMQTDPFFRSYSHNELTFRMMYATTENFVLALSHDEVVHGKRSLLAKMPGDWWQQFANLRTLYGYMFAVPGKKLLFMGNEFGQWNEWDHERGLDWALEREPMHQGMLRWMRDLNLFYRQTPAMHELDCDGRGFEWIDCHDYSQSTLSFIRRDGADEEMVLAVCNFTPEVRQGFRLGVPREGRWRSRLNSDDAVYGGGGVGNPAEISTDPIESHGRPWSLVVTLPPLAVVYLEYTPSVD